MPYTTNAGLTVAEVDGARLEYRLLTGSDGPERAVVVLPGAHMSAACSFGEDRYLPAGSTALVLSRPGYGRTSPDAGRDPATFAHRVAILCRRLGLTRVTALGVSMGARSALSLAADHPDLVEKVIVTCGVSFGTWPDPRTRRTARVMFNPLTEGAVWALLHHGLRRHPARFLSLGVSGLSTLPPATAIERLGSDVEELRAFLGQCRSGRGFMIDLRAPNQDPTMRVRQPTLILSSRFDGAVGAEHPQRLAETIPGAQWIDTEAPTHLLWLGDRADIYARAIATFGAG